MKINNISKGAIFSIIAAFFQLLPIIFSELFTFLTILSTVPIYVMTRIRIRIGIICYLTASLIIMIIGGLDEFFIFILINGLLGLIIGTFEQKFKNELLIIVTSAVSLIGSLLVLNLLIDFNVFLINSEYLLFSFALILILPTLYVILMRMVLHYCYDRISKRIKL